MTLTAEVTKQMVMDRATGVARDLRDHGYPVMGVEDPDDLSCAVGITFRRGNGHLATFRLHFDDAGVAMFRALFQRLEGVN